MITNINEIIPPNLENKALLADVQAFEPYGSAAFNRQMRGVIKKGVYAGFSLIPAASGLKVVVSSAGGESAAAIEVGNNWLINVKQQADVTLALPAGRTSSIILTAYYDGRTITDQVHADSTVRATELLVVNAGSEPSNCIVLGQVNVPSNATSITLGMIDLDRRDRVSLEGFWNKLDGDNIAPKGQWVRTYLNRGIKPSLENVRAAAVDSLGTTSAWFKESWVNSYRGGSIDVEGTIRAGGKLAMLKGDFGLGGVSALLADGANLNDLSLDGGNFRGTKLLNTPEGAGQSTGWWFVEHVTHSADHVFQRATKYSTTGHYGVWFRTKLSGVWQDWDNVYSVRNKPTKTDVGLSLVANERQYSAQNNNIGTGETNYAAGNHNHDSAYSKLSHTHNWDQINNPPAFATRWPTLTEIGAQPAGNYAAANHGHLWSQISNIPEFATRWPSLGEIGAAAASHGHLWSQISNIPEFATRWPSLAEIGAAAASHGHSWSQLSGIPATATRWPTLAEIGAANQNGLRDQAVVFEVGGDANTYYPVQIIKGMNNCFGMDELSISRYYGAKAPDTWNTPTHKGGLTFSLRWSGDVGWGGNDHLLRVIHFSEQYTTMVGGLELSVSGLIVWLRGGGAQYTLQTINGLAASAVPHLGGFTSASAQVYQPKAYDPVAVANQVHGRMTARGLELWDSNCRVYSPINKPTPADLGAAAANHSHASISSNYTNWLNNSEAAIVGGLAWRNYGNNHVIFDASKGITPSGSACSNNTPNNVWSASYPTLMGFDGVSTFGVRVDTARNADSVAGLQVHSDRNNEPHKVVRTDANGYLQAGWINTSSGATNGATLFACFQNTSDMYLRYMDATQTRNAIGAQVAGSYAAASHTHSWSQIADIPVYATRWPNNIEVGLGNVPNLPHSYEGYGNHVPIRDSAGDITARLFKSEFGNDNFINGAIAFRTAASGDNYMRFCSNTDAVRNWIGAAPASHGHSWAQISGIPETASRWPSWSEIGGKPPSVGSDTGWINIPMTAKTGTNPTINNMKKMQYRVLNGIIYFDFQIVFLDAGTTVAYTRLPNWSYGEKYIAGTGFGDRAGSSESKLFRITASGDIYNAINGMSQFHVVTGLHPTPTN